MIRLLQAASCSTQSTVSRMTDHPLNTKSKVSKRLSIIACSTLRDRCKAKMNAAASRPLRHKLDPRDWCIF
eukprot:2978950-Amphidinium_carterae.2